MLYELERIGNNESILFHMFEYSIFDLNHLLRKQVNVDIIISANISHQKILFEKSQIRISENLIQNLSVNIGNMLDFISIALDTKCPSKKPHRFTITTSQVYEFFSTNKF